MPTRRGLPPPPRLPSAPRDESLAKTSRVGTVLSAERARERPTRRRDASTPPPDAPAGAIRGDVSLRLAIGRDGVGLELEHPATIGCLTVTELTATLPGIHFPVDVSGGVPRFRHRRGALQSLQAEVRLRTLERWAAPRLRGLVGVRTPEVWIGVRGSSARVCVSEPIEWDDEANWARPSGVAPAGPTAWRLPPILAFDVEVLVDGGDLKCVVTRARGTNLPASATAVAIGCVRSLFGGLASREGALFVVRDGARTLARRLLPEAGARVPDTATLAWESVTAHADVWIFHAARGGTAAAPSDAAVGACEVSAILREGDDALVRGEEESARALYLDALERAPRHREIARRIFEIDARTPGRVEAAISTLGDASAPSGGQTPSVADIAFGTTPGELLAATGDIDAAMASLERTGETEGAPALAARAFELAARISVDADDAARWLDCALARAPRSTTARFHRISKRLELGRLEEALSDVEHLEALAKGRAKFAVLLCAGRAWQAAGLGPRSAPIFERALRHAPDEPRALAGLAAALVAEGQLARGVSMLARAIELCETKRVPDAVRAPIVLDLAQALADGLGDLPAAIARASTISLDSPLGAIARGLEGRWRARLGDLAGAALAFARLRDAAASVPTREREGEGRARGPAVADLLVEAAALQRDRLQDNAAAQRYLAAALRLRPRDASLRQAYREIGALVAGDRHPPRTERAEADIDQPPRRAPSSGLPSFVPDLLGGEDTPVTDDEASASARAEELMLRVHSNPHDDAAADELATLLEQLGRGHELLALLCGRLDDAAPERRAELAPRTRNVLARLAAHAEANERLEEAALFRDAIEGLSGP